MPRSMIDRAVAIADGLAGMRSAPTLACWSIVHGFARLAIDGAFGESGKAMEQALQSLLPPVFEHLTL